MNTELVITNVYIPQQTFVQEVPSADHLMMATDTLILEHLNAHHSVGYPSSTDTKDTKLKNMMSCSNLGILNWDSTTRLPRNANPFSSDVALGSASPITSTNWQRKTYLGAGHLPILIMMLIDVTINPIPHRNSFNIKKGKWDRYRKDIEEKLSNGLLPINCKKEKISCVQSF